MDDNVPLVFDNSSLRPLAVPGYGHPLSAELPPTQCFLHGFNKWVQDRLTARELAMLQLMNAITDQPGWQRNVYDNSVVARWAADAAALSGSPLISEAAWAWCLAELRDKAQYAYKTGLVFVFNAGARICKSDSFISAELLQRLTASVEQLSTEQRQQAETKSTTTAPLFVNPYWLPLVYGETRFIADGSLGLADCVASIGFGAVQPAAPFVVPADRNPRKLGHHRFSPLFQWLPCEVLFRGRREENTPRVQIQSYINNVHPLRHQSLYEVAEALLGPAIQSWDDILLYRCGTSIELIFQGRDPMRIRTFGAQWQPDLPAWAAGLATVEQGTPAYDAALANVQAYLEQPDHPFSESVLDIAPLTLDDLGEWSRYTMRNIVLRKYARIRQPAHPEPGTAFTYDEWKQGKVAAAVVPPREDTFPGRRMLYDHTYYTLSLEEMFADKGLQVVVEVDEVSLLSGDPPSGGTGWQLAGVLNDHIVATSVIYFDSENVTPGSGAITFRVEAEMDQFDYRYGADTAWDPHHPFDALKDIFGFASCRQMGTNENEEYDPARQWDQLAVQELGTVATPDGRLVSFPNAVHHRIEPCTLADPSRPGRRRVLRLHLVDPHYRVLSTRNVPPQQASWWREAVWDHIDWAKHSVPPEIQDMIAQSLGDWPAPRHAVAEKQWHDIRHAYGVVWDATFARISSYRLGPSASEGYDWPVRFPGEPAPPLDWNNSDDDFNEVEML
ncbi:hypothetical protein SEUCBS139899_006953 [Sporothrix eucalyptigena]|uniref:Uncharacterized protein n=1 Tax=Sporothrix eucalyptigena TaxID=1812306 RepID=A0ABP0C5F2_9PEZI